jgi:hypothetical protein
MLARENFAREAGLIDVLDIKLKMNIMNIAKYGIMLFIHLPFVSLLKVYSPSTYYATYLLIMLPR